MDAPLIADPVAQMLDASGVLATDVACRRCGYNLRGLQPLGLCPECGSPVGLSTSGDLLRFADPNWVAKLGLGIKYILWGMAANIIFGLLGGIASVFVPPPFGGILSFAGGLVSFYGAWLLTEPDPSGIGEERYTNARKVIRFALLVGLVYTVAMMPVQAGAISGPAAAILLIVSLACGLIGLVGEYAKLRYLEQLALRIPEPDYAARARFLRRAYVVTGALMLVCVAATVGAAALTPRGSPGGFLGFACFAGILGIALLVFSLMYLRLLYRLRKAFEEQAAIARQTWAAAAAPSQA